MTMRHTPSHEDTHAGRGITRRDAIRAMLGAGAVAALAPSAAFATSTQQQLDAKQLSFDQAQERLDAIGQEVADLAGQLSQTQQQVGDLEGQIAQKQADIDATQQQIEQTLEQVQQKQGVLGERMSAAYKSGSQSTLDVLLSSSSFEELTGNIFYLDKISQADRRAIDEVRQLQAQLEDQKGQLEDQKGQLEEQKADLEDLEGRQQQELADVQAKQAEAQQLVDGLSEEVRDLMAQRDAELVAAQKAAEEERRRQEEANKLQQQNANRPGPSKPSRPGGGNTTILGNGSLAAVVAAANSTPSPGSGLCAAWVSNVFARAGVGSFGGNADDMYYAWCGFSTGSIQPGMIIAVPTAPYSPAARLYGHVGIYLGNGIVRHNQSGTVKSDSLQGWISTYSKTAVVRCGWLGGIALS